MISLLQWNITELIIHIPGQDPGPRGDGQHNTLYNFFVGGVLVIFDICVILCLVVIVTVSVLISVFGRQEVKEDMGRFGKVEECEQIYFYVRYGYSIQFYQQTHMEESQEQYMGVITEEGKGESGLTIL